MLSYTNRMYLMLLWIGTRSGKYRSPRHATAAAVNTQQFTSYGKHAFRENTGERWWNGGGTEVGPLSDRKKTARQKATLCAPYIRTSDEIEARG